MEQTLLARKKLIFPLTDTAFLEIKLPCVIGEMFVCTPAMIKLYNSGETTLLFYDCITEALHRLNGTLKRGLSRQHFLIAENKDIGYLWNEYLYKGSHDMPKEKNNFSNYLVWSNRKMNLSSWIFKKNSKIVLEITPNYPWHYSSRKSKSYITYEKFIKGYKPYAKFEISRTKAKEWVELTSELITLMFANEEHARLEYEAEKNCE